MTRGAFATCHPIIGFVYFVFVICVTIFFLHPVMLAVSFAAAAAYTVYLKGRKAVKYQLLMLLPLMVAAAAVNPLFSHAGMTILGYFQNGNPLTLESILYGLAAAAMIGAVILWFACYSEIMTSDKFLYLFGKAVPALSLVISMTLRFIPRYIAQTKKIANAQRGIGKDVSSGGVLARARSGLSILSVMVTWALENAIETSDSMRSRGYGLKGRTAYSDYRFGARDKAVLAVLSALIALTCALIALRAVHAVFFPAFLMNGETGLAFLAYAVYFAACALPLFLDVREDMAWRSTRSRI
jgi:energy-coupling factor transport system permease protein